MTRIREQGRDGGRDAIAEEGDERERARRSEIVPATPS